MRLPAVGYIDSYNQMLGDMVERQMQASVKLTGDLWYSAWIEAGQPDISLLSAKTSKASQNIPNVKDTSSVKARTKLHYD